MIVMAEKPTSPAQTYIYSLKCQRCDLHFQVYSWFNNWHEDHNPWCPECGGDGQRIMLFKIDGSPKFIFEFVGA